MPWHERIIARSKSVRLRECLYGEDPVATRGKRKSTQDLRTLRRLQVREGSSLENDIRSLLSPSPSLSLFLERERATTQRILLRTLRGSFECTVIRHRAVRFASCLNRITSCKAHFRPGLFPGRKSARSTPAIRAK